MTEIPASLLARAMKHATERDRLARVLVIRWQLATGVRLGDSARETLVAMIVTRMTHQYHLGERFGRRLEHDEHEEIVQEPVPLVRLGPGGDFTHDYTPEASR